jgi:hypothetical protein
MKEIVEILDLLLPVSMWTRLELRKHEALARVEALVYRRERAFFPSNFQDSRKPQEIESSSTSLENKFVRINK